MIIDDEGLRSALSGALEAADPTLRDRLPTDPEAHLDLVALTARTQAEAGAMLRQAVAGARAAGCTWESIGRGLGTTGQVAEQRYRTVDPAQPEAGATADPAGRVIKLSPLYAFNEMAVLEGIGRYGWHAVASGTGMHLVRPSDVQWEHRRVFASRAACRALEREGWERWTPGWFPWAYYNRRTDLPAEPEPPDLDLMHP